MSDEYDDLSDLKPSEMEQVKEWELQFRSEPIQTASHGQNDTLSITPSHPLLPIII